MPHLNWLGTSAKPLKSSLGRRRTAVSGAKTKQHKGNTPFPLQAKSRGPCVQTLVRREEGMPSVRKADKVKVLDSWDLWRL